MCLSSILSFESLPAVTRRFLLRGLYLITLVLLGLALLNLTLASQQPINLYGGWENQQAHLKLSGYQSQWMANSGINVLLFGNSVVQTIDVKQQKIHSGDGEISIYNGGVGGIIPETAHVLLNGGFYAIGVPDVVIYVLGPRDLRDRDGKARVPGSHPFLKSVKASSYLASDAIGAIRSFLEQKLYLFGIRKQSRYFMVHGELPKSDEITANEFGVRPYFRSELKQKSFSKDFYYRSRYNRFGLAPKGGQLSYLKKLILSTREKGATIVLATSPISPACFSLFDDPPTEYGQFLKALKMLASETETPLYDMHAILSLPNEAFTNADHVNRLGAKQIESFIFQSIVPDILESHPKVSLNFFDAYHPHVRSWYQSVRKQAYSTPQRKSAKPGPSGRPTEYICRGVNLHHIQNITGTLVAGTDKNPATNIVFSVLVDDKEVFQKQLESTSAPIVETFSFPIRAKERIHSTIIFRTETTSSRPDQPAFWENVMLTKI